MPSVLSRPESGPRYHHSDDEIHPGEDTPLIRLPPSEPTPERDFSAVFSIFILILVLVIGAVVGIYLLVVQNESENVLPPVTMSMAKRAQLVAAHRMRRALFSSNNIFITDTNSTGCATLGNCNALIRSMQSNDTLDIAYHMFVASNGLVMKTLPAPSWENGFNVALFGNFTKTMPHPIQVKSTAAYLQHQTDTGYLDPYYKVIVKKDRKHNLYKAFKNVHNFCPDCRY